MLGPLLFCLYINDVQDLFQNDNIRHILYADDLQVYTHVPYDELESGAAQLSAAAEAVSGWSAASGLRLNPSKTQAIFFAPTSTIVNRLINLDLPGVSLEHGAIIPFAETVFSLRVVLDRTLSWKPHFDKVTSKVNRVLYSLRFFRSCTTELIRGRLVQSLIFLLLDYCSIVILDATCE